MNNKENKEVVKQIERELTTFDKAIILLEKAPITDNHISKVIDAMSQIAEMRVKQSIGEAETLNKIRLMVAEFRRDSERCEKAIHYFREFSKFLSDEEKGLLSSSIIKVQLGVSPDKL